MSNVNLDALKQLTNDFYGDLNMIVYKNSGKEYDELSLKMKQIRNEDKMILYLFEGNKMAIGHTLSKDEAPAFQRYSLIFLDRCNVRNRQLFLNGVILGSGLREIELIEK